MFGKEIFTSRLGDGSGGYKPIVRVQADVWSEQPGTPIYEKNFWLFDFVHRDVQRMEPQFGKL